MKIHDIMHIARYEAKQQSRDWMFWFFVFFSLTGITLCHVFLQGQGYCTNWKLLALPCSIPLVNAYLFCVVQSLFVIMMIIDFPRREGFGGALEQIYARPIENDDYTWGRVLGILLLFALVNVLVMLACVLLIHVGGLSPLDLRFYLFYFLTLNVPSLLFIMGLSLWLMRVVKSRPIALLLLLGWLVLSVSWLPYRWHGTLDFLATGVPNLFSGLTGHIGLEYYLLHRLVFLLLGLGLLLYSVKGMKRMTGRPGQTKSYIRWGIVLIVGGIACGLMLESSYLPTRETRENYRESFRRHWVGRPCHVEHHAITVNQYGNGLEAESDLILCNMNEQQIDRPLLFLNPGLKVTSLQENCQELSFERDGQVIVINRRLSIGDSLRLKIHYEGRIDERYTDLQLSDRRYEDSFRGDHFFPTGRRSAFVGDDYLLITPACGWYPMAIAPINPDAPMCSGRDITRFQMKVVNPNQRILFSQGVESRRGDTVIFEPSSYLSGISLCGGEFKSRELNLDSLKFSLNTFQEPKVILDHFAPAKQEGIKAYFQSEFYFHPDLKLSDLSWEENGIAHARFIETPLSFLLEFNEGRFMSGQVEPGMTFLPESGFGMDLMGVLSIPFSADNQSDNKNVAYVGLYDTESEYFHELGQSITLKREVGRVWAKSRNSHPLLGWSKQSDLEYNLWNAMTMFYDSRMNVYSVQYPFIDLLFMTLYSSKSQLVPDLANSLIYTSGENTEQLQAYVRQRSLEETLQDGKVHRNVLYHMVKNNLSELINYLSPKVSMDSLFMGLEKMYHEERGTIDFNRFAEELKKWVGGDVQWVFNKWLRARHDQYFVVKDLNRYFYPADEEDEEGWVEMEGKVMNRGKEGGFVFMGLHSGSKKESYSCYIEPGKAKSFHVILRGGDANYPAGWVNTGMAINRPNNFSLQKKEMERPKGLVEIPATWTDTDISVFQPAPGEIIVDDLHPNFSFDDQANQTLFQKWFGMQREGTIHTHKKEEERFWNPIINMSFYGDSLRHAYYKSFGTGNCTATWTTRLEKAGKYRVMVMTGYEPLNKFMEVDDDFYTDVIFYYTVHSEDGEKEVELWQDEVIRVDGMPFEWQVLGEFDFPTGEVSVTLSDKDKKKRKNIIVIADAVKWIKMD